MISTRPEISAVFVGDIMLDRGVRRQIEKHGIYYPFEKITSVLKRHDIVFCNLESIISNKGHAIKKPITFRADTSLIKALKWAGFNVINIANNHALDFGRNGLKDCIKRLADNDFNTVGGGNTLKEAYRPLIIKKDSIKLAFVSYCDIATGVPERKNVPEIARFNLDTALSTIRRIKDSVDFVIVSLHWGTEYVHYPSRNQKKVAHSLIDAGASIIIGHHPHVIQEVEFYKGKTIFYSLGNFIFDQRGKERNEGIMFACTFTKDSITNITLIPYRIKGMRPELLTHEEKVDFIRRYKDILHLY